MIAVIFELEPKSGCTSDYFELAEALKLRLSDIDGFVSIERFQSLANLGRYLSLSFWRDEAAVACWRNQHSHREAQKQGRAEILQTYRLRVASVLRDHGIDERSQVPDDSNRVHR